MDFIFFQKKIRQIAPTEKKNLIDKILQDRRKLLSEQKPEEPSKDLNSPEENWDDLVNKDVLNIESIKKFKNFDLKRQKIESDGKNQNLEAQIYNNLSKINKNLIFNSDSKVPMTYSPEESQTRKQVKFDQGYENSVEKAKTNSNSNYFQKLKNK